MNKSPPFVEVRGSGSITLRQPTDDELRRAKELKAKIDAASAAVEEAKLAHAKLVASCQHEVSIDVAGFPEDSRFCYVCNEFRGLI